TEGPLPGSTVEYPPMTRAAAFVCSGNRCSRPAFTTAELKMLVQRLEKGLGLLGCWVTGLLGCWVAGLRGCEGAGLRVCGVAGLRSCDSNEYRVANREQGRAISEHRFSPSRRMHPWQ